jgi:hypothetical protein
MPNNNKRDNNTSNNAAVIVVIMIMIPLIGLQLNPIQRSFATIN